MSDATIRRAAFDWLADQVTLHDDVLPWRVLVRGFDFKSTRVPLVSMQGIFKPRVCELPLSIRTAIDGPYDDRAGEEGRFLYAYRGTNPNHRDNVGLRELMRRRIPLVYFFGLLKGRYLGAWPVFVVDDNPRTLTFTIQLDDATILDLDVPAASVALSYEHGGDERRRYVTRELQVRLHQRSFRERVLHAYHSRCAVCRLRHRELLDAAHIVPDSEAGAPRVPNGLALCKLHHAAFDKLFVGVRPNGIIEVRRDILDEEDGPMLLHGLKRLHQARLYAPRRPEDRPDPNLLEIRYERFVAAGG
ncbi:MAG: HNH endonuclease [Thiotrichales bacterium]|nr:HNH endonuclease [Thiotrichales bacterium]